MADVKMEKVGECPDCGAPIYAPEWDKRGDPPANAFTCVCRLEEKPASYYYYYQQSYVPYVQPFVMPAQPVIPSWEPSWTGGSGSSGG